MKERKKKRKRGESIGIEWNNRLEQNIKLKTIKLFTRTK